MSSQIDNITKQVEKASTAFNKAIATSETQMYDEAVTLIKTLDVDGKGRIVTSVNNLKRLAKIRARLAKVANNKEYLQAVKELVKSFDTIYNAQQGYFAQLTNGMADAAKYKAMKEIAIDNTVSNLTGAGLQANVTDKINDMLLKAVTTGAKFSDLTKQLNKQLTGLDEGTGVLSRYAKTYATTALSQFVGQNNKLLTDDLGCEWFMYTGGNIETTREFCERLTAKKYIHKSEIPEILKGFIDGHQCRIYDRTGLPYGMIEGTNEDNFQVNVGGWNCGHQLVPVAEDAVPKEIRAKFEKHTAEEIASQKAEEEKQKKVAELKAKLSQYQDWKDMDEAGLKDAIVSGDIPALESYLSKMKALENQLAQLDLIVNPKQAIKDFTFDELKQAQNAIAKTMSDWLSKYNYGTIKNADPLHLKAKCEYEIGSLKSAKKHATWEVAARAYEKYIKQAERQLTLNEIASDIATLKAYKTKSSQYKQYVSEAGQAIAVGNITKAKSLIATAQAKQFELEKRHSSQAKGTPKIDIGNTTQQKGHVNDSGTREEIIGKLTGTSDKGTIERYLLAANGFSYEWDWEIRQVHCGNTSFTSKYGHSMKDIQQRAADLEEYITKAPKWAGGTTYRGMSLSLKEVEQLRTDLQAGHGNMQGAASWSTRESCSQSFAGHHIGKTSPVFGDRKSVRVVLVAHRHRKATSIKYLSEFSTEDEVLSSKDCRWRIVREYTKGGYTYFDVEPSN